jgi:hypothetical protein
MTSVIFLELFLKEDYLLVIPTTFGCVYSDFDATYSLISIFVIFPKGLTLSTFSESVLHLSSPPFIFL